MCYKFRILIEESKMGQKRSKRDAVEVVCPKCKHTEIVYIQAEDIPRCPQCNIPMVIREILTEGKSY
jgi:ribosomal protein S27E